MYGWSYNHKSHADNKSSKYTQNPSFSSTILNKIYLSMNIRDETSGELKHQEELSGGRKSRASSVVEDEGIASLRRAFFVQKWIDMKGNAKSLTRRRKRPSSLPEIDTKSVIYSDPYIFSSRSVSSDSSCDVESFYESKSRKPNCFGPFSRPKHVKTEANQQTEFDYCLDNNQTNRINHGALIKSKARALKIYADLKKVKQLISPGGRLTTFLNSLFANGYLKRTEDLNSSCIDENNIKRKSKTMDGSACSSASSFTRSCLSKNSPRSREKVKNGIRRTVRFYPVSVIIDESSHPCGEKFICGEEDVKKFHLELMFERKDNDNDVDDAMASDSSSDLFELDHLSILKECEELPVYETTHFSTNCAIANGFIY